MLKIYGRASSANVQKVTWLCTEIGLPYERQDVGGEYGGNDQDWYLKLNPNGRVIITVPSPRVDDILHLLLKLRLISGIAVHEHYGFQPADTLRLFPGPRFRLLRRSTFQLGLNNLFVFERSS